MHPTDLAIALYIAAIGVAYAVHRLKHPAHRARRSIQPRTETGVVLPSERRDGARGI